MQEYSYNNNSIAYNLYAGGDRRILLLHDIGGSSGDFQQLVQQLCGKVTLIAPDLCGHGESYLPRSTVSLRTMAREVVGLLHEKYIGRVDVVAAGAGGAVALEAFSMSPESFGDFVFLDTFICPDACREMSENLRPAEGGLYAQFRNTFKRWVPAYRDDFFIFCSEFDGRDICRLSSSRMLFVYADRNRGDGVSRSLMRLPEYSNIQLATVAGAGRALLQKRFDEVLEIIRRFLLDSESAAGMETDDDDAGPPPDMGNLLMFR